MSNNNLGYSDNYPPVSNRTQASQSPHQNFPTSSATTAPYHGLQGTDAGKTYSSRDNYQYGQYRKSGASSTNNLYNWNQYSSTTGTGADSTSGAESVEQRLLNATRAPTQSAYDPQLENLGYGSNLTYCIAAEASQPASNYSGTNLYGGATKTTANQRNTRYDQAQARPVATAQRTTLAVSKGQRQVVETTPRTNTAASYNLPSPSPTCPQGLINSFPDNASAASMARINAVQNVRTNEPSTSQSRVQQPSYTQTTYYGNSQQGRAASRMSPEQMRKTQTPTPPVPPIRMATPETRTNTYVNQSAYQQQQQQPAQETQSERAFEAAQTLAENMHHQTNFGMNALQEVQHGEIGRAHV